LNGGTRRVILFLMISVITHQPFLARATIFGVITLWERGVLLVGQTHLILRGRGTRFSKILGFLLRTYLRRAKFGIVTQGGRGVYDIPWTYSPGHIH